MGRIFTRDEDVEHMVASCLGVMWVFVFFDGLQGVASGVLRGCGKQAIGALTNFVAFYCIGIPLAYVFAFKLHLGVGGLIRGISFASLFQCCVLLYIIVHREDDTYTVKLTPDDSVKVPVDSQTDAEFDSKIASANTSDLDVLNGFVEVELGGCDTGPAASSQGKST